MYEPRIYRMDMNRERFSFFRVVLHESDLLIGVPDNTFLKEMKSCVEKELIRIRKVLRNFARTDPSFLDSLDPLELPPPGEDQDEEIRIMISSGLKTGTGPMASVAGLFAQKAGEKLRADFGIREVVVENGGDLYVYNTLPILSVIHAGRSSLSDRLAFQVPAGEWGICTSSGTMGHSYSRGRADAVTVIMHSAPLADAWATALANQVSSAGDMEAVLDQVGRIPEILGFAVLVDGQIGIRGELEVKMLSSDQ